jgi:uncharacterized membrane protein
MIGFFSRFVGLWLIAGALVALVVDATKSIAASTLLFTSLGDTWGSLNRASLVSVQQFFQRGVETYVGHWLWDPLIMWILLLPTWAILGAAGFLLTYLGRRRKRKAAYG